jgi:hypothetical protein
MKWVNIKDLWYYSPIMDILSLMSGNPSITIGLPPGSDVAETLGEPGVLTRSGHSRDEKPIFVHAHPE